MELEELEDIWGNMSEKLDQKIILSDELADNVKTKKFRQQRQIFWKSQIGGFILAYILLFVVILYFNSLQTWIEKTAALIWAVYLALMPLYTLWSVRGLKDIDIFKSTYQYNLYLFLKSKKRVIQAQTFSLLFNPVLFFTAVIVIAKLFLNVNAYVLINNPVAIGVMGITLVISLWGTYRIYKKNSLHLTSLQEFIKEEK